MAGAARRRRHRGNTQSPARIFRKEHHAAVIARYVGRSRRGAAAARALRGRGLRNPARAGARADSALARDAAHRGVRARGNTVARGMAEGESVLRDRERRRTLHWLVARGPPGVRSADPAAAGCHARPAGLVGSTDPALSGDKRGQQDLARHVVIIGAGAAGTMAAIFAAASGAQVTLLERTADGGRKILISGGGRCNILPARLDESRFVTDSSRNTLHKIVRSWPLAEQRAFFENDLGLRLVEETESGKLFPESNRARDVRDGLLSYAMQRGARIVMNSRVTGVLPLNDGRWRVERDGVMPLECDAVIIATGGLSVPATGSDGAGLSILAKLGHAMHPTYAALTPVTAE